MQNHKLLNFFLLHRQIFGICPNCNEIFRLSDCNIYLKKKPAPDWFQKIENERVRIEKAHERLDEKEEGIKELAREKGRKQANKMVRKIDKLFNPRKLNPDDSKVIFHPIDYIVFNGMKKGNLKNILLLDSKNKGGTREKAMQKSIEKNVEKENYEWITLRVEANGNVSIE